MSLKTILADIADIKSWFFTHTAEVWDISYLQAKNFNDFGELRGELIPDLKKEDIQDKHLLMSWDILFCAKWTRNFAAVYKESYGKCVASSTFLVIRIHNKNLFLPWFIALILNNLKSSNYFREHNLTGTTVQSISKKTIESFDIWNIPIEKQKHLLELYNLHKKQIDIHERLIEKKDTLINNIILQYNSDKNVR